MKRRRFEVGLVGDGGPVSRMADDNASRLTLFFLESSVIIQSTVITTTIAMMLAGTVGAGSGAIIMALSGAGSLLVAGALGFIKPIGRFLDNVIKDFRDNFPGFGKVFDLARQAGDWLGKRIRDVVDFVKRVGDWFEKAGDWLKDKFDWLKDQVMKPINAIKDYISKKVQFFKDVVERVTKPARDFGNRVTGAMGDLRDAAKARYDDARLRTEEFLKDFKKSIVDDVLKPNVIDPLRSLGKQIDDWGMKLSPYQDTKALISDISDSIALVKEGVQNEKGFGALMDEIKAGIGEAGDAFKAFVESTPWLKRTESVVKGIGDSKLFDVASKWLGRVAFAASAAIGTYEDVVKQQKNVVQATIVNIVDTSIAFGLIGTGAEVGAAAGVEFGPIGSAVGAVLGGAIAGLSYVFLGEDKTKQGLYWVTDKLGQLASWAGTKVNDVSTMIKDWRGQVRGSIGAHDSSSDGMGSGSFSLRAFDPIAYGFKDTSGQLSPSQSAVITNIINGKLPAMSVAPDADLSSLPQSVWTANNPSFVLRLSNAVASVLSQGTPFSFMANMVEPDGSSTPLALGEAAFAPGEHRKPQIDPQIVYGIRAKLPTYINVTPSNRKNIILGQTVPYWESYDKFLEGEIKRLADILAKRLAAHGADPETLFG